MAWRDRGCMRDLLDKPVDAPIATFTATDMFHSIVAAQRAWKRGEGAGGALDASAAASTTPCRLTVLAQEREDVVGVPLDAPRDDSRVGCVGGVGELGWRYAPLEAVVRAEWRRRRRERARAPCLERGIFWGNWGGEERRHPRK